MVADRTASVLPSPVPQEFADQVEHASKNGGAISLIGVNGAGTKPSTVLLHSALNTPGELDRPSVAKVAAVMPQCIKAYAAALQPTGEGTDLYQALSAAAEIATSASQLWTFTDLLSNTGQFALTDDVLAMSPDQAAARVAGAAPLDLHGATWHLVGLAGTDADLLPANRAWLQAFAGSLCSAWNATGCDAIAVQPVLDAAQPTADAPKDPAVPFPSVTADQRDTGCDFTVPSSVTFASDSAELIDGAEDALRQPIELLQANPGAVAVAVGHTASTDRESEGHSGLALSEQRAAAVAGVIAEAVGKDRVTSRGVGDSKPLGEDLDPVNGQQVEAHAARERRVEVLVEGASCRS